MNRERLSLLKRLFLKAYEWVKTVLRAFLDNNCAMHAAGLTYYSMLALVPILCVLLLLAKTFGADQIAKEKMHGWFEDRISQFEVSPEEDAADRAAEVVSPPETNRVEAAVAPADGPSVPQVGTAVASTNLVAAVQAAAADRTAEPPADRGPTEAEKKRAATQEFVAQARSLESGLMERVEQFNIGTLGWVGLLMLVWTVIGSIGMVEVSFNEIWEVRKQRVLWRRILLYLFVTFILPVLVALAVSVPLLKLVKDIIQSTAGALWLTRWLSDGVVWVLDSWALRLAITLFFSTLVFAFLFKVLPNCRVRFRPAFWSGLVTAFLFGSWFRLCAVAQVGIAKSSALYGSFALLPIVLAWLYMSWQIVLLGCCMVRASFLHAQGGADAAPPRLLSHSGDNPESAR